jgi:tetratricopeptide (TPR) repeat protein
MLHRPLVLASLFAFAAAAAPADGQLERGRALLRDGKLDEAVEVLEEAVEAAPGDAAAQHLLGGAYGRQASQASMFGKMRLAGKIKDAFERAVALAPEQLDYRESLIQFYAQAPAVAGGGIDKAKGQAAEIAKRDALRGRLANALIARLEGKHDVAIAEYQAVYAARPDDSDLGVAIGIYLQDQKRWEAAFAHFGALVARRPDAMSAWYQLGRTAVLADARHAEGEAALKRYLAHQPTAQQPPLAAAQWRLGMLYEQMQRIADARAAYQAALKLDPKHAESKAALSKLKG